MQKRNLWRVIFLTAWRTMLTNVPTQFFFWIKYLIIYRYSKKKDFSSVCLMWYFHLIFSPFLEYDQRWFVGKISEIKNRRIKKKETWVLLLDANIARRLRVFYKTCSRRWKHFPQSKVMDILHKFICWLILTLHF